MISVDPLDGDNKGNKAFADAEHADFPLLSDPTKDTAKAYGVLNDERGFANRWTFYIGKDGKIHGDRQGRASAGDVGRGHGRQSSAS